MTKTSETQRVRTRCQATTKAGVQCRSTAVSADDGLCSLHSGRLNPVELGRMGGRARGKKSKGRLPYVERVRRWLDDDADERELGKSARGIELAMDMVAREDAKQAEVESGPIVLPDGQAVTGLADVVRLAYAIGQAHLVGLPVSAEELEALVASGVPPSGESRSPKNPVRNDALQEVSVDEQDPPETEPLPTLETDDLVDPLPALPIPVSEDSIAPIPKTESSS